MSRGHGTHKTGFRDLSGQQFGLWLVLERAPNKGTRTAWTCRCACGAVVAVTAVHLTQGASRSCGCVKSKTGPGAPRYIHGQSETWLYLRWAAMVQRCTNPNSKSFVNYGGRGITVCAEWRESFAAFAASVGQPPAPGLSIDRIDNDRGYEPGNVRWATVTEQARNRRAYRRRKPA